MRENFNEKQMPRLTIHFLIMSNTIRKNKPDIIDDITDSIFTIEPDVDHQSNESHCRLSDECKMCIWMIVITKIVVIVLLVIYLIIETP